MRKAVSHLKRSDPVMSAVMKRVGPYRIEFRDPTFDTLVRSIIYQQLSGAVAKVLVERLRNAMPDGLIEPEAVLRLRTQQMRGLGLSTAKTEYIRELARHTVDGTVDFPALVTASDEEVIAALTHVKGIGVWTAQMFLIFALRRLDVLPLGDLGVRKAMMREYGLPELPKPATMLEVAAPWRPYCSVASWYLWRSLDGPAAL